MRLSSQQWTLFHGVVTMLDPVSPPCPLVPIGVGFDTARFGHHVTFLDAQLDLVCPPMDFVEAKAGYDSVRLVLDGIQQRFSNVHFHIRLDAAGQYAANLEAFLRQLPFAKTISVGEPARNQHYRLALFPKRKADPVESLCAARFALLERPQATESTPHRLTALREVVARLQGQTRTSTRLANQLHNLLARVFPELAPLISDLQAGWVLQMLQQFPTPALLAAALPEELKAIAYFPEERIGKIQQAAAVSVGSLRGDDAASLVRLLVGQLKDSGVSEAALKKRMAELYGALPTPNHLDTIPGIGVATAAVLTAKMVAIERFASPARLVNYFGIFPEENTSGLDKDGRPRIGRKQHMSRKGNDLVRKYLWNAAKSAVCHNPAVRPMYRRLRARGVRGDVALGHAMRKLLHLVWAVWHSGQPFDPKHHPWEAADAAEPAVHEKTAGHKEGESPVGKVVTTAHASIDAPAPAHKPESPPPAHSDSPGAAEPAGSIDYAALREQISMEQVLEHIGCLRNLRGSGSQRRGPCPLHAAGHGKERTFSVHLDRKIFQCFDRGCAAHGNVLDLWAKFHKLPLYQAAIQLMHTFNIAQPQPQGTEKRNP